MTRRARGRLGTTIHRVDEWNGDALGRWRFDVLPMVVEGLVTGACEEDRWLGWAMQAMHDAAYQGALGGHGAGFLITGGRAATELLWAFVSSYVGMNDYDAGPVVWLRIRDGARGGQLPEMAYGWLERPPKRRGREKWSTLMRWMEEQSTRVFVVEGIDRFADLEDMPVWLRAATRQGVAVIATRREASEGMSDLRMWMADLDMSEREPLAPD